MKEKVEELEKMMQAYDPVVLPLKHHFADGIYAREMFMPAGAVLTGAVHKTTHMCRLSQGRVRVATADGPVAPWKTPCGRTSMRQTKQILISSSRN